MRIINRGYLLIKPKPSFIQWANAFNEDLQFDSDDDCEGSIYLIEEDFLEIEPIIEKNFKKILKNELLAVTDEENFPEKLNIELFFYFFDIDFGSTVFDLTKQDLLSDKID